MTPRRAIESKITPADIEPEVIATIVAVIAMLDQPEPCEDTGVWVASARAAPSWRTASEGAWRNRERLRGWAN